MQNFDEIYPMPIDNLVNRLKSFKRAKAILLKVLPTIIKTIIVGLILLILQIFLIGVADRFLSMSPKVSFLLSSLFYVFAFIGLALVGSLKEKQDIETVKAQILNEPICKMLIIKRKKQEINI